MPASLRSDSGTTARSQSIYWTASLGIVDRISWNRGPHRSESVDHIVGIRTLLVSPKSSLRRHLKT